MCKADDFYITEINFQWAKVTAWMNPGELDVLKRLDMEFSEVILIG